MEEPGPMSQRGEFVAWVHTVLRDAEVAIHNGEAALRRAVGHGVTR